MLQPDTHAGGAEVEHSCAAFEAFVQGKAAGTTGKDHQHAAYTRVYPHNMQKQGMLHLQALYTVRVCRLSAHS